MKKNDKFLNFLKDLMSLIIVYIVINLVFVQFFMRPFRVEGESMQPNLSPHELGFSNVYSFRKNAVQRFDIVIVFMPDTNRYLVKRVIGLPNETLRYEYDKLYINDEYVEEPFLDEEFKKAMTADRNIDFTSDFGPVTLGENEYYLLGDNRPKSSDSRIYGSFSLEQIKSKNGFVFYPFNKIRKLSLDE